MPCPVFSARAKSLPFLPSLIPPWLPCAIWLQVLEQGHHLSENKASCSHLHWVEPHAPNTFPALCDHIYPWHCQFDQQCWLSGCGLQHHVSVMLQISLGKSSCLPRSSSILHYNSDIRNFGAGLLLVLDAGSPCLRKWVHCWFPAWLSSCLLFSTTSATFLSTWSCRPLNPTLCQRGVSVNQFACYSFSCI